MGAWTTCQLLSDTHPLLLEDWWDVGIVWECGHHWLFMNLELGRCCLQHVWAVFMGPVLSSPWPPVATSAPALPGLWSLCPSSLPIMPPATSLVCPMGLCSNAHTFPLPREEGSGSLAVPEALHHLYYPTSSSVPHPYCSHPSLDPTILC